MGLSEGSVGIVEHGYDEDRRCLDFRAGFYGDPEAVLKALRVIDSYNEFEAERVWRALGPFVIKARKAYVGREGSPVLYLDTRGWDQAELDALEAAAHSAGADEVDPGEAPCQSVRIWWD